MITSTTEIQSEKDIFIIEDATKLMRSKKDISVESYDVKNKRKVFSPIISTRCCDSKDFIMIKTESNETIIVTLDHKIYTPDGWLRADALSGRTQVMDSTTGLTAITDLHRIQDDLVRKVYTLTIEDTQCYFANNILVHNDC